MNYALEKPHFYMEGGKWSAAVPTGDGLVILSCEPHKLRQMFENVANYMEYAFGQSLTNRPSIGAKHVWAW